MIMGLYIILGFCLGAGFITLLLFIVGGSPMENTEEEDYSYIDCNYNEFESDYANGRDYKEQIKRNQ